MLIEVVAKCAISNYKRDFSCRSWFFFFSAEDLQIYRCIIREYSILMTRRSFEDDKIESSCYVLLMHYDFGPSLRTFFYFLFLFRLALVLVRLKVKHEVRLMIMIIILIVSIITFSIICSWCPWNTSALSHGRRSSPPSSSRRVMIGQDGRRQATNWCS